MISKTIQNEIINILHKVIIKTIVTNVKKETSIFLYYVTKLQISARRNK